MYELNVRAELVKAYLSPAARRAVCMAGRALPLRRREVVHVRVLGVVSRDNLIPVDGPYVAQVVVVEHAHAAAQNICNQARNALRKVSPAIEHPSQQV